MCSYGLAVKGYENSLRQHEIERQLTAACNVCGYDEAGFQLWNTPNGKWWAPARTTIGGITVILAEQRVKAYGDGVYGVRPGDTVLDCGANIGMFTREALNKGAKQVIAVEPAPENIECLKRNFANDIVQKRVVIYEKGVWDRDECLTIFVDPDNSGGNSFITKNHGAYEGDTIQLTTIDRLVEDLELKDVGFIKIDVEAAEQKVLNGARRTLTQFRPRLAIAVEHTPDRVGNARAVSSIVQSIRGDYRRHCNFLYFTADHHMLPEVLYFN
jgi:FkbM family methyltransferase